MKDEGLLGKRRDTTRVIYEVLSLARRKVTKTQIVYKANLNFQLGAKYLEFLVSKSLLQQNSDSKGRAFYELTEKGSRLLLFMGEVEKELIEAIPPSPSEATAICHQFLPRDFWSGRRSIRAVPESAALS